MKNKKDPQCPKCGSKNLIDDGDKTAYAGNRERSKKLEELLSPFYECTKCKSKFSIKH